MFLKIHRFMDRQWSWSTTTGHLHNSFSQAKLCDNNFLPAQKQEHPVACDGVPHPPICHGGEGCSWHEDADLSLPQASAFVKSFLLGLGHRRIRQLIMMRCHADVIAAGRTPSPLVAGGRRSEGSAGHSVGAINDADP